MGSIINGTNFNIYYVINGNVYPACHAQDGKITGTADVLETTTKDGRKGKTYNYSGKYSYTLSLKGITNLVDGANIATFNSAIMQSNKLPFIFTDSNNISWSGIALITQFDMDSPIASLSTFTNTMLLDGELTQVTSGVTPPVSGGSVIIQDQFGTVIAEIPAPGTYQVLRFDTLDLRGWNNPDLVITSQEAVPS